MGLRQFWHRNKVLIVMCPGLGLIHWGWYVLNSNPVLQNQNSGSFPQRMLTHALNSLSSLTTPAAPLPPPAAAPPADESK